MDVNLTWIKEIRKRVLRWYSQFARPLPWRGTTDPYKIWLCEIILQQTRIEQGTDYYFRFLENFPTLQNLALADESKVLKVWEGLGYYTRARNLLKTAQIIYHQYEGHFPQTYEELLELPGIGPYTASAIGSICFNLPVPTLDGNVRRVLSRLFEIQDKLNSTSFCKTTQQLAEKMISLKYPGNFNQGMMDIGSIICTPTNPNCTECPLKNFCLAYQHGTQTRFPVKEKIRSVPILHWAVGIIINQDKILLTYEVTRNFLKNLYALPTVDITDIKIKHTPKNISALLNKKLNISTTSEWEFLFQFIRKYSHRTIYFYVYKTRWKIRLKKDILRPYQWVPRKEIHQYPFSRAYSEIIQKIKDV
ncbi:MAG TPA: A/G-specific adenine glycosylase [Candidatus Hydrogenedens sp.]|nr:A/G-specific adenine glycosylase [Candidatus Hydrogenedens sp.]